MGRPTLQRETPKSSSAKYQEDEVIPDTGGRVCLQSLLNKVVSVDEATTLIHDGMTVGMSGFTRAGDCKAVSFALARRAAYEPLHITLITGVSLDNDIDRVLAEADAITRRLPFQVNATLRRKINAGEVMFIGQHLSETVEQLRSRQITPLDVVVVEATAITENGDVMPTTSVGNSANFTVLAKQVITETNLNMPANLEGLRNIFLPVQQPYRQPIPFIVAKQHIGLPSILIDPRKITAIVIARQDDSPSNMLPPDMETNTIAGHLDTFLTREVRTGHLSPTLQPLQAGIGTISNMVLHGFIDSPFHDLKMYPEVLQDSSIELLDSDKLTFVSASSITLSYLIYERFPSELERYKTQVILRPQETSNHPGVIRHLGLTTINTALECDIYGNMNSTHAGGAHIMNDIGGSGDFPRSAHLSVFTTKSLAKDGDIPNTVPMVPHVDHIEHDVDIIATEHGLADLCGLAPRERAVQIASNCTNPYCHKLSRDYVVRTQRRGGHTPRPLEGVPAQHVRFRDQGSTVSAGLTGESLFLELALSA